MIILRDVGVFFFWDRDNWGKMIEVDSETSTKKLLAQIVEYEIASLCKYKRETTVSILKQK
jgi:hypothetical protein